MDEDTEIVARTLHGGDEDDLRREVQREFLRSFAEAAGVRAVELRDGKAFLT